MTNGTQASERLLTRGELAKAIGVSSRTVDRMLADREITPVPVHTRLVRFYLPDVVRQLVAKALTSKRGVARQLAKQGASRTGHQSEGPRSNIQGSNNESAGVRA